MKLTNPTDDQLNAAFAEKVAGWINQGKAKGVPALNNRWVLPDRSLVEGPLQFMRSADAVLPWLSKQILWDAQDCAAQSQLNFRCWIRILTKAAGERSEYAEAREATFPRAAVIALLRAHGVEVEFTT